LIVCVGHGDRGYAFDVGDGAAPGRESSAPHSEQCVVRWIHLDIRTTDSGPARDGERDDTRAAK